MEFANGHQMSTGSGQVRSNQVRSSRLDFLREALEQRHLSSQYSSMQADMRRCPVNTKQEPTNGTAVVMFSKYEEKRRSGVHVPLQTLWCIHREKDRPTMDFASPSGYPIAGLAD